MAMKQSWLNSGKTNKNNSFFIKNRRKKPRVFSPWVVHAMETNKEILKQIKDALVSRGVNMDVFSLSIYDGMLEFNFQDAYNCEHGYNSGFVKIDIAGERTIDDIVFKAKVIFDAWEKIITTADIVYLGE